MDFSKVPLMVLTIQTKQLISTLLNPPKVLPSSNGLPRDWRGLAHALGMTGETIPLLASHSDPAERILASMIQNSSQKTTIKNLQNAFVTIERWDVLDDTEHLLIKDAQEFAARVERSQLSAEAVSQNEDRQMLTIDDKIRFREGLGRQHYDAFLLYADEDFDFAKEMLEKLEEENMKLCLKDRDLIAGLTFEHEAIMELISNRCNRLIVIMTTNFFKSPANKYFIAFAQAEGIDKQQRKLIPCIYEDCELPVQLKYTNKIKYNQKGFSDFWKRLYDSIKPASATAKVESQTTTVCYPEYENRDTRKLSSESCDIKVEHKISETEHNESTKSKESPNHAKSEPELYECARVSTKTHAILENFFNKKTNKLNLSSTPEEISEDQICDSLNLPSPPSDSINLLPTHSEKKKKKRKRPKFVKTLLKKIPFMQNS